MPGSLRSWQRLYNYPRYSSIGEVGVWTLLVNDPLGWDVLDTLQLLACLVEQFGGCINLAGSDLAQGQLSN